MKFGKLEVARVVVKVREIVVCFNVPRIVLE
jgi:hypothetical protein